MDLNIPCKTGKIRLKDGMLRVTQFGSVIWEVPANSVTGFVQQPGVLTSLNVTIQSTQGPYFAETVTRANYEKLCAAFAHLATSAAGSAWYESPTALTHVATYTDAEQMQREMEQAYQRGWMMQGQSAIDGQSSATKVLGGAIVAGPLGALMGAASKSKGQTTVTFVRTPEWMASNRG